ncbi:unnamed protein product [Rangifer tarandus platyrhynchus]|uniref:Uncharacterized protein n=1 Tax=Rangifer tarandus platyrhynchus TaxID=3082113 RepID=A0ABN8YZC0_RANTA|nr:unnamed protein product [Rangifer tarandus platyrhynchus]
MERTQKVLSLLGTHGWCLKAWTLGFHKTLQVLSTCTDSTPGHEHLRSWLQPRHFSAGGTSASNSRNASSSHPWDISDMEKLRPRSDMTSGQFGGKLELPPGRSPSKEAAPQVPGLSSFSTLLSI